MPLSEHRHRRVYRNQSDTLRHGFRHTQRLRSAMDITQERCAKGFRHRHVLDPGHERGHHLLLPDSRIHARPASFLFGSILAIDSADLCCWAVLPHRSLLFTFLLRPIQNIAFDSTFARSQHLPVTAIEYLMMTLIAMTIVLH